MYKQEHVAHPGRVGHVTLGSGHNIQWMGSSDEGGRAGGRTGAERGFLVHCCSGNLYKSIC